MANTKVVLFDVKEIEEGYLNQHKPDQCDFLMFKGSVQEMIDSVLDEVRDADVISVFTTSRVPGEILDKFTNLKLVTARSTGFNHIDTEYCRQKGIPVVNVPRYGDCTVAEFAFGLLLNVIRKIDTAYRNLQNGIINVQGYVGRDLNNKTIGIIGTGAIGQHAVKIANGFCMKVLAYDSCPKKELEDQYNVKYVELDELLRESDIISLHAPSTKENFHMINDDSFSKMKKGVVIINTARGEIMDTDALYRALKNGIVAGAGLDVLECEDILNQQDLYLTKVDCINKECLENTLINNRLITMPNVIVTPHIAFDSIEAIHRILQTTIQNINAFLSGNVQNKVN